MTVVGAFRYDVRPYSGYDDPGLPVAAYIAQGALVGDASGGSVIFTFVYQEEQDERITELFNLEQLSIDTNGSGESILMQTVNMDTLSRNRAASPQMARFVTVATVSQSTLNLDTQQSGLPLWLGSPNLNSLSGLGALRFSLGNTDLRLYAITIQGHIWSARSILAQGGPRRPVGGGLFKS